MKVFILDTNVILHDCLSILKFEENIVILPITVLEELDHFKKEMNELGRNARHFSRLLDDLRTKGSLAEGVPVNDQGGMLKVVFCSKQLLDSMPPDMDMTIADNRIMAVALHVKNIAQGSDKIRQVVLITQDTNVRIRADALGLAAETYENGAVDFSELYSGYVCYDQVIDTADREFTPNEFLWYSGTTNQDGIYKLVDGEPVALDNTVDAWGLVPRNEEQRMAMDLLLDDSIKLVTLVGKAGTGKTLLALAAGLRKVTDEFVYRKLLVSRPVFPMGKDIGFLPGDINEKLAPYMQPIYDNVEFLMSGYSVTAAKTTLKPSVKRKKKSIEEEREEEKDQGSFGKGHLELIAAGIMEVEPLLYIRGRSIPKQFMIIDESQNLTPHEVKTIVTRAGEGTKLVFTGDPNQIDNPYLDASSNGLTYLVERMKKEKIAGHITLTRGERSELAEIASNIL